jgi:hypothetical protein
MQQWSMPNKLDFKFKEQNTGSNLSRPEFDGFFKQQPVSKQLSPNYSHSW